MTRLSILLEEREQIRSIRCLAFNIREEALKYYDHEIECITEYGSPNPDYDIPLTKEQEYKEASIRG